MSSTTKHIVFICSRLDLPGGTERAIVNAANQLCADLFKISILVLDCTADIFYPLHQGVQLLQHPLHFGITDKGNVLTRKFQFLKHLRALRLLLQPLKPDVVIGTEYVYTIAATIALYKSKANVYSWEHHHYYWLQKNAFWSFLLKKIYPKTDGIICLNATEEAIYKRLGCKTLVIPYYVERASRQAPLNTKTLLTIGWLIRRKGVDLIPEVAERVFQKHPDWQWKIVGTGPEYELLKKLINEKKLIQNIEITEPVTSDLSQVYMNASVYVMLSRSEGLPFVLLEALSFGVPSVAFDCLSGPSDIIRNNVDGFLVNLENTEAMSNAILRLIENEELRTQMGTNAYARIERFSLMAVLHLWRQLLNQN